MVLKALTLILDGVIKNETSKTESSHITNEIEDVILQLENTCAYLKILQLISAKAHDKPNNS